MRTRSRKGGSVRCRRSDWYAGNSRNVNSSRNMQWNARRLMALMTPMVVKYSWNRAHRHSRTVRTLRMGPWYARSRDSASFSSSMACALAFRAAEPGVSAGVAAVGISREIGSCEDEWDIVRKLSFLLFSLDSVTTQSRGIYSVPMIPYFAKSSQPFTL